MVKKTTKLLGGIALSALLPFHPSFAAEIDTNIAQMQAMDKITGKVSVIEVPVNGNVNFGSFSILVRACKTRSPEDTPENFAFVDVVDNYNNKTPVNIFRGWMISSSPALNPVEHPIYDVWLLKCINGNVNPSQLLTKEELAQRDLLPKAPKISDEAKLKANEADSSETKNLPTADFAPENVEVNTMTEPSAVSEEKEEIESVELKNYNMPSPSLDAGISDNIDVQPQEDGAPKLLLNINNDFAPQAQNSESQANEEKQPVAEAPLPNDAKDDNNTENEQKETPSKSFLNNFLSFGKDENAAPSEVEKEPQVLPPEDDSSIDIDEIDKELMQLQ